MNLKTILGATIAVILIGSLLVPIVDSTQESFYSTAENTGYSYKATNKLGNYEYSIDTTNHELLVNGTALTHITETNPTYGIASQNLGLSYFGGTATSMYGSAYGNAALTKVTSVTINDDGTWSLTDTTAGEISSTDSTKLANNVMLADNDGNYGVYLISGITDYPTISVNRGEAIYLFCNYGQATANSNTYALNYMAKLVDGEITVLYAYLGNGDGWTDVKDLLTVALNSSVIVTMDKINTTYENFRFGIGITGYTLQVRNVASAPLEYHAAEEAPGSIALISVIPIMVILALFVGVASTIIIRSKS